MNRHELMGKAFRTLRDSGLAACVDIVLEEAAKVLDQRIANYVEEHGIFDPETRAIEFPGNGEDFVSDWEEIAEEIRALTSKGTHNGQS